jgi:phosphoenolpyruvate carboxykinase (GTP)
VAPGTSLQSNPHAMKSVEKNTIFTNVALTPDGDIWWEGMTKEPPAKLTNWLGEQWTAGTGKPAAHANARYTAPASQCPVIDSDWENPNGVPISAIIFGGRRSTTVPLVLEALNWQHGTFLGATQSSETTAAAAGKVGQLRRDPMAMLPFCGYNMGDYFAHWLATGHKTSAKHLPRIYYVNWFRKDAEGRSLWPGFGENARVLKWIFDRVEGRAHAILTPIGLMPAPADLDTSGLKIDRGHIEQLLKVDIPGWMDEATDTEEHFARFGNRLPQALLDELRDLRARLAKYRAAQ